MCLTPIPTSRGTCLKEAELQEILLASRPSLHHPQELLLCVIFPMNTTTTAWHDTGSHLGTGRVQVGLLIHSPFGRNGFFLVKPRPRLFGSRKCLLVARCFEFTVIIIFKNVT